MLLLQCRLGNLGDRRVSVCSGCRKSRPRPFFVDLQKLHLLHLHFDLLSQCHFSLVNFRWLGHCLFIITNTVQLEQLGRVHRFLGRTWSGAFLFANNLEGSLETHSQNRRRAFATAEICPQGGTLLSLDNITEHITVEWVLHAVVIDKEGKRVLAILIQIPRQRGAER